MKRAILIGQLFAVLAIAGLLSGATAWAKPNKTKDSGSFSTTCLSGDANLSDGATVIISPASLWPPKHSMAGNLVVGMKLNADANTSVPVSFSIISISDDQEADDDEGGHGCGPKTSKQGPDFAPANLSDQHPLTVSGNLHMASDSIATAPGEVQLRRERCGKDGSRVYELEVICCDNTVSASPECDSEPEVLQVIVPHDRGRMK